ncbi:glycosyltransferase family 2 protein [Candidatus Nomurabacteria bacterium]|nr:glycosyltransferase family 2 protein [Candidatus Nomurabacteria bacterium]
MEEELTKPLVSVIIPAHNENGYIEKTLLSVLNSSYKNYEIIVVCDSCSDNTEEISKRYTDKVYSVNFKNAGGSRNFGVSKARGEVFAFLDADTICSENYLFSIVNVINSGFDYGCSKIISETGTHKGKFMIWRFNHYNRTDKTFGGNCFVRKEWFSKVNGFDIDMMKGEDTDLGNRLFKSGAKYFYIEDAYIITSERRFIKYGYLNYFINSMKDAFWYSLNNKKYKEIYKRKTTD